jgi:hypothetical protein
LVFFFCLICPPLFFCPSFSAFDVICNFIDINDIDSAVPVDPENKNFRGKCDFIVQTRAAFPSVTSVQEPKIGKLDGPAQRDEISRGQYAEPSVSNLRGARNAPFTTNRATESSKPSFFRESSVIERNQWIDAINLAVARNEARQRQRRAIQKDFLLRNQMRLRSIYVSAEFQMAIAACVWLNFLAMVRRPGRTPHSPPNRVRPRPPHPMAKPTATAAQPRAATLFRLPRPAPFFASPPNPPPHTPPTASTHPYSPSSPDPPKYLPDSAMRIPPGHGD